MAKKNVKKNTKKAKTVSVDRQVVDLSLNMFVLKQSSFLVLPETPNIYLSPARAKKLIADMTQAVRVSRDGIIIRFNGPINPGQEQGDGSMFLTRELTTGEIKGGA
ncbi:MAG: hypothetical protein LLG37_05435 [Spirochaetia bacterium]|nr:hypothetical protein [Spirochaetia bacterium]